jgi:hypothetical protein
MIARSDTSAMVAAVASPDRSECPAYLSQSNPAAFAHRFTTSATDLISQPLCSQVAVTIDRPEDGAADYAGHVEPGAERAHWAGERVRAER